MGLEEIVLATKNELDITCDDQEIASKIQGIVKRGITYLNEIAGVEMQFTEESIERGLLYNYARYALEGMENEFELNYRSNLVRLRLTKEAEKIATQEI